MDELTYIDTHLHFHNPSFWNNQLKEAVIKEFTELKPFFERPDDNFPLLGILDALGCHKGWVINYESPKIMGYPLDTNEWVANFCDNSDNRLVPFGGIDPRINRDFDQIKYLRDFFESDMLKGFKFHGPHQWIAYNGYNEGLVAQAKIYDLCQELKIPIVFHTGSSMIYNARSKFGDPMLLEDVAIDYPDLKLIMAHGGRPFWTRQAEYLMIKFDNLYMDISSIPPYMLVDYFPRLLKYADRVMFGSDYPSPGVPSPRLNADEIAKLPLPEEIIMDILFNNANKLIP